ncbi:heme o synthase [Demequina aurantiaca]|uniref:heme o synthase n=1 Tax=Demequina aurantiaca TaxID=676200 RepID=UPI000781B228|nr:heme o synthase [Demequina aurantiaca]
MPTASTDIAGAPASTAPRWRQLTRRMAPYVALTKPRIIELLLVTTLPTMVLAADGWPGTWLMIATLIGGSLSAGSANTFNMYIDRDIDAIMKRTQNRPLVTGAVTPRAALIFGWVLAVLSTLWFWLVVDSPLAAALSVVAIFGYAVIYTMVLKRRTSQNIVWGGAAGCMPVLIGWAAVTQSLSWTPFVLFMIIFLWTPPHYWPLSMKFKKEYAAAEVPMLPVVASSKHVAVEMVAYAVAMVLATVVLVPLASMTWVYAIIAVAAGAWFTAGCIRLYRRSAAGKDKLHEMRLFRDSIMYLTVVFAAILVDPFLPNAWTVWPS